MEKWAVDAEIMKLRGLGYHHDEIAKRLKMKRGAVQYRLNQLRKRADDEGINTVFFKLVAELYIPKAIEILDHIFR